MSKTVPEEWAIRTLSDLASIDNKSLKNNTDPDYRFRYIDIASVKTAKVDIPTEYVSFGESPSRARKCVRKGDVLMSTVRPNLKGFAYFDVQGDDFVVSTGFAVLTANKMSDSNFLYQSILSDNVTRQIESLVAGSNYPAISSANVKSLEVLAPPLPEQQKIATILSSVDDVIEKTRAQIDKLKDLKTGMMQELLTKGVGHTEFKDSSVGRIPTAWNIVAQGDVAKFFNGRAYKLTEWEDTGTPVIRLQNLTGSGRNFYYSTLQLPERQYCEKGDLLYMWSATFGPHIWQGPKAIYHYHIWKVEADETKIKKAFLFYLLDFKTKQWKEQSSNGMGILHVTKGAMEEMELALPPISEQQQIATALQATDLKLELSQQQLEYRLKIKKALMQDLLTGKVRVNLTDKESAVV